MQSILEDLRYAAAVLRRTPSLTAVAVLTLALGIAATTTVFGWIDGMVLHPFRGAADDGQVAVLESVRAGRSVLTRSHGSRSGAGSPPSKPRRTQARNAFRDL